MNSNDQGSLLMQPDADDYTPLTDAELVERLTAYQGGKLEPLEAEICNRLLRKENNGR